MHGSRILAVDSFAGVATTEITIDIQRMFLNVPVMSWLSLEHSMDKCGYLGYNTLDRSGPNSGQNNSTRRNEKKTNKTDYTTRQVPSRGF